LITAAGRVGLLIAERNVALLAAVRDGTPVPRASFFQLNDARRARPAGNPHHIIGHEDVLVFRTRP
jgi:hypothetical protein